MRVVNLVIYAVDLNLQLVDLIPSALRKIMSLVTKGAAKAHASVGKHA